MKGHVRQRGGTWVFVLDLGRGSGGKRRQKWQGGFRTRKDAERELTRVLHELNTGAYVEPSKFTVSEYLGQWLEHYAKTNVAPKTAERYAEIVKVHLAPALGGHPLARLQPLHIQTYYSQALQSGRRDGQGGLSAQTVLHHHRVLREALRQAVKWQLLARNPADAVEPPRPRRHETRTLDEEATARLLEAVKGGRLYLPVLLAATTGMRRGEILALRWQDVDLRAGTLAVRQSMEQTREGCRFKQPKTQKSRRVIALPPLAVEGLRRHKAEQAKQKLLLGPGYQDNGLVCAQPDGQPWSPGALTNAFRYVVRRAGYPGIRFHDLRHGHASQLLRAGIHPKVVSERLGHSTVGITLDTYSHVLPGLQEEAARRIDTALRAASQKIRQS